MRMDHFGFYAVDGFAGTPIPFVLTLLVNLLLAVAAGLMYDFLYAWQVSRGTTNPYKRAAWVLIPPIAFVYICMLFISCAGTWLYLLEALPVLAGVLMAVTVLRDETVKITTWSKRFLLQTSVIVTVVLTAISLAGMVAVYLDPSLQFVADHTLIRSWEVDFNALGYPPEELVDRSRISTVWSLLGSNCLYGRRSWRQPVCHHSQKGHGGLRQPCDRTCSSGSPASFAETEVKTFQGRHTVPACVADQAPFPSANTEQRQIYATLTGPLPSSSLVWLLCNSDDLVHVPIETSRLAQNCPDATSAGRHVVEGQ